MFRFTIRDVLWLTVVVGLGLGWASERAADSRRSAAWEQERLEWLNSAGKVASKLAKEKGEVIYVETPGPTLRAHPADGYIEVLGRDQTAP